MTDLLERLQSAHENSQQRIVGSNIFAEAANEIERLWAVNERLKALLMRYRTETPLGHQPHMIAHAVDATLGVNEQHVTPASVSNAQPAQGREE